MRNPFSFFIEMMQQPVWIQGWVLYLMIVNVASVAFWDAVLAKIILITFILSAILMMGLYSKFGFEKILGIGHFLWFPLLVYVWVEFSNATGTFKSYLIILSISIIISLLFDIVDVWKYIASRKST